MAQPSWIGRSLGGRYQIEALLGQGGMSAVYKANDPNLKRVVAVKLIHSHLATDKQFVQRFEEEAAAVASLRHPNIVQVYDFNSDEDTHYMVLEFVPGETLQERLQRLAAQGRKLPVEEAIKYTLNICDALGYAHQRGMIHRDIKPANIMLDVYGQAILMDFGIVKIIGGTSHTATGAVLGTARYISPELIRSEPADPRSDIYSLGITMYEMLSGQTPFVSDSTMSLMMMHLNDPVPDPRALRADLPTALVNILLKTLEKDRTNRYQNVGELAADLKRLLASSGSDAGTVIAPVPVTPAGSPTLAAMPFPPSRPLPSQPASQPVQSAPNRTNQSTIFEQPFSKTPTGAPLPPVQPYYTSITGAVPAAVPAPKKISPLVWLLGLGGGLIFILIVAAAAGIFMMSQFGKNPPAAGQATATIAPPTAAAANTVAPTVAAVVAATIAPANTDTPVPAPTATLVPTATYPPFYVRINSITRDGNKFSVQYETFGFVEKLPYMHVHFFFDTVTPDQAGVPGAGPWILYGGPRPFTGYSISQKPAAATQMCALVANPNHTVLPNSGNCVDLP